jgi:hypothetical protein
MWLNWSEGEAMRFIYYGGASTELSSAGDGTGGPDDHLHAQAVVDVGRGARS